MKISTVICTRNRPDTIEQAVKSICLASYDYFDIHIVDQSQNDFTKNIIFSLDSDPNRRCDIHYHHTNKPGLSRAYNYAMRVTNADIVAFTDDDVIVDTNWLTAIYNNFIKYPSVGLIYGQVLIPSLFSNNPNPDFIIPNSIFNDNEILSKESHFRICGMGANMAIRRDSFNSILGFDEALGGGGPLRSSQDFDYTYRTYLKGHEILLAKDVKVDHYGTRSLKQWPDTMKNYGIGDGGFLGKHIRCGDLYALKVFILKIIKGKYRKIRHIATSFKILNDPYYDNLISGFKIGLKFPVDKSSRLYIESDKSPFNISDSNTVTSFVK